MCAEALPNNSPLSSPHARLQRGRPMLRCCWQLTGSQGTPHRSKTCQPVSGIRFPSHRWRLRLTMASSVSLNCSEQGMHVCQSAKTTRDFQVRPTSPNIAQYLKTRTCTNARKATTKSRSAGSSSGTWVPCGNLFLVLVEALSVEDKVRRHRHSSPSYMYLEVNARWTHPSRIYYG